MKKKFLLFTALFLLLSVFTGSMRLVSASEKPSEPKIGEKYSGFRVESVAYDNVTNSLKILFEHVKTGARLLVINNKDTNRGFTIKFNTPADNDKGINHIIEHSVLGGSEKYPSNNMVFDLSNTTYTSFANAYTGQNMTFFPICSKSEEQLLKSMDIYLDAVFHPLLLKDERIFNREAWRYELNNVSDPLTYNGIVYTEMQGSLGNIENAAFKNAKKAIFPDSNQGNNSGGVPEEILKLTYKEYVDTYKKNYHPSNSLMVLYGDLDYKAFLKVIDRDYLSSYKKKNYSIDRSTQKAFKKLVEKTYTFPVAKGTDTKNKAVIDLVFATSDIKKLGLTNLLELSNAVYLMNLDNSTIKQAMQKSNIAESYSISIDKSTYQPTIHFIASNADASKKKDFYDLVMKELKKIVKNGLDSEMVKSALRNQEFNKAFGSTDNSAVVEMQNAVLYDNLLGDPMINEYSYYETMVSNLDKGVLEEEIEKQIVNNSFAALTVTEPKEGLLEKNKSKEEKALAAKKASMTKKELNALVKKTEEFNTWNNQNTSEEVLKSLRAVALKDLTIDVKERKVTEATVDKAKLYTTTADVASIGYVVFNFDLSHMTMEELLYLKFYSDMINNGMATTKLTESQVINQKVTNANSLSMAISPMYSDKNENNSYPILTLSYLAFEEEFKNTFELASDILLNSKISDISTYGTRAIANLKANYAYQFSNPVNLINYRSLAYTSKVYRLINYITGLDYYKFILALEEQIKADPVKVAEKLEAIRTKAFNKSNLTILFAGNESAQQKFTASVAEFTKALPDMSYPKESYSLPVPARREALAINSTVQYISVNSSFTDSNVPQSGKMSVITTLLNNLMLIPEIRLKGGAYSVSAGAGNDNYNVITYRDGNYVNSLKVIGATDEFLKSLAPYMTEDALESYKLTAFAAVSPVTNELVDAISSLQNQLAGYTTKDRIDLLTQIKQTTIEDITIYAEYMAKLNENMNYVVAASPSEIEANKDLFDVIIPLQ
jgi:Zn-dependent M16 (insulinase) family peptidase